MIFPWSMAIRWSVSIFEPAAIPGKGLIRIFSSETDTCGPERADGAGIRLGFLSNLTEAMMEANIKGAGLEVRFEQLLSADRVQAYRPDPRAYQMGIDAFRLPKQEILFAAFGGWDAAGAKVSATRLTGRTD